MQIQALRSLVREFFDVGVAAADPGLAVRQALRAQPLPKVRGRVYLFAIGKAAVPMIAEAIRHVPSGVQFTATAVTNYENAVAVPDVKVFAAGHPLPDQNGLVASQHIISAAESAGADDFVLCLISGGGSALLPAPPMGVSLDDKIKTNDLLLASGFDIIQMNMVRQHLSGLKGGGLAKLCHPAQVRSLIVSDVMGDDPRAIASGPTASHLGSVDDTRYLLNRNGIWQRLPASVRGYLDQKVGDSDEGVVHADNTIIASNRQSLDAIVRSTQDFAPVIVNDCLVGDVGDAAHMIVDHVTASNDIAPRLFIWGGETTVKVTGNGQGGRNQELALRVAHVCPHLSQKWVFLSGGTDGRDGPTNAAGGLVDAGSIARMAAAKINIPQILSDNDSYRALGGAGDLLITGATGTNVADIQLFLQYT